MLMQKHVKIDALGIIHLRFTSSCNMPVAHRAPRYSIAHRSLVRAWSLVLFLLECDNHPYKIIPAHKHLPNYSRGLYFTNFQFSRISHFKFVAPGSSDVWSFIREIFANMDFRFRPGSSYITMHCDVLIQGFFCESICTLCSTVCGGTTVCRMLCPLSTVYVVYIYMQLTKALGQSII